MKNNRTFNQGLLLRALRMALSVVAILLMTTVAPRTTAQGPKPKPHKDINAHFDKAARELANVLSNKAFREFLLQESRIAQKREQRLPAGHFLAKASGRPDFPPGIRRVMDSVAAANQAMKELEAAEIDLYFPVKSHREEWQGEDDLLIASAPIGDESQVTSIIAYSVKTGQPVTLDPATAPDTPTLFVAARESSDIERQAPLEVVPEPLDEPEQLVVNEDPYIGVPYVYMLNDEEPWWKGDPEIYVLVGQSYGTTAVKHRIDLGGVNEEGRWYKLGDGPGYPLYFYFDSNYSPFTYYKFMEEDTGSPMTVTRSIEYQGVKVSLSWTVKDGDDSLGSRTVNRDEIPWSGHYTQSTGDMIFKVDKHRLGEN